MISIFFYSSDTNMTIGDVTINFVIQVLCILLTKEKNDVTIRPLNDVLAFSNCIDLNMHQNMKNQIWQTENRFHFICS